jgi:hypothetical protein
MTQTTLTPTQARTLVSYVDTNGDVRRYSGRSMYGAQCLAVVADYPASLLTALIYELTQDGEDDLARLLATTEVREDNMGRRMVAYWPHLALPTEFRDTDDEEN